MADSCKPSSTSMAVSLSFYFSLFFFIHHQRWSTAVLESETVVTTIYMRFSQYMGLGPRVSGDPLAHRLAFAPRRTRPSLLTTMAVPPPDSMQQVKKTDEDILTEVIKMGFDRDGLIESLRNRVQNEGTVAYYLLLDNRFRNSNSYLGAEFQKPMEGYNRITSNEAATSVLVQHSTGYMDYQGANMRIQVERKWALGLQSRAHPREIMTEVLKALQELNVCWKKIGHYNMKCRWNPGHHEGTVNNGMQSSNYFEDESTIVDADSTYSLPNVVKFEVQLYKTREEKYLLDLQRVNGPQFLFLELCAAFLAQLRVL